MRALLDQAGFTAGLLEDTSEVHLTRAAANTMPTPPGQLRLGMFVDDLAQKAGNAKRSLDEGRSAWSVVSSRRNDRTPMESNATADLGFSFRKTKDESVAISRGNRVVTILRGRAARQFLFKAAVASDAGQQQLMARVTGNYKRGNERLVEGAAQDRCAGDA